MRMEDIPVAILAGGLATRLRPLTERIPKALVEVAGRPFIDHQLRLLRQHGTRRVVLCLGHLGELVEAHLGDGRRLGLEVGYSYDGDKLLGTGGAIKRAAHLLGDVFWILYGDSYLEFDYAGALRHFAASGATGLMTALRNDNRWDRSNLVFRDGRLLCYSKRQQLAEMNHIDYGASLLRREALARFSDHEPSDLADLFTALVAEGRMTAFEVTERFYEIGSPRGLEETRALLTARAS